jgi:hypothetical protein
MMEMSLKLFIMFEFLPSTSPEGNENLTCLAAMAVLDRSVLKCGRLGVLPGPLPQELQALQDRDLGSSRLVASDDGEILPKEKLTLSFLGFV